MRYLLGIIWSILGVLTLVTAFETGSIAMTLLGILDCLASIYFFWLY